MNLLWAGMMLAAVVYGAFHGTMPQVTQAAIDSSKEAVVGPAILATLISTGAGVLFCKWMTRKKHV